MTETITVDASLSREKLGALCEHVYNCIAGREADTYGIAKRFWSAFAYSMFKSIWEAFLDKRDHKRDELGNRWKDLAPSTKAYSRMDARKDLTLQGPKTRPTLTPEQDRVWRGRFYGIYKRLAVHMQEKEAKSIASSAAWDYVKKQMGADTLINMLKNKAIPILHRTGALQRSLFPAPLSSGEYTPLDAQQVYQQGRGILTLGTKVPYAADVDKERPLWPEKIPLWMERAIGAGRDAVYEYLPTIIHQIE